MKIEIWFNRDWHCRCRSGGNITFSASGYDTEAIARRAVENHAIALYAVAVGMPLKVVTATTKASIRKAVRAKTKLRPPT